MTTPFEITEPQHIVFEAGAEDRVGELMIRHGAERVMVLCDPVYREGADRVAAQLGNRCVGVFAGAKPHVPEGTVREASQFAASRGADWIISHGGGTATGVAKAVVLRSERAIKLCAIPTTYAGSERTSIWGITGKAGKTTGRDPRVRPALVVYDPNLTLSLSKQASLESLFNAMAQAVARLFSPGAMPDPSALEAVAALKQSITALAKDPQDRDARSQALYGAYLAGACIEHIQLGLQHALAHTLGGHFGVRHSAAHTASLPWSIQRSAMDYPEAFSALQDIFGDDPAATIYDIARANDLPHSFKHLDLRFDQMEEVAQQTFNRGYLLPGGCDETQLRQLCDDVYHARRPSRYSRQRSFSPGGVHGGRPLTERGEPLETADVVLIAMHGRGAAADRITRDFENFLTEREGLCILAPQAFDNAWYPKPLATPVEEQQPGLDGALAVIDALWDLARHHVQPRHIVMAGFSQGACLLLSWARLREHAPGALLAFSGAHLPVPGDYRRLTNTTVYTSKSESDPYFTEATTRATWDDLRAQLPDVTIHLEPGPGHALYATDGRALDAAIQAARPSTART